MKFFAIRGRVDVKPIRNSHCAEFHTYKDACNYAQIDYSERMEKRIYRLYKVSKMPLTKFYAVKKGHEPGVYMSYDKVLKQVKGYSGAVHKSFDNYEDACAFAEIAYDKRQEKRIHSLYNIRPKGKGKQDSKKRKRRAETFEETKTGLAVYTDGSGNGGYGIYFGDYDDRNVSAPPKPCPITGKATSNRGELQAVLEALNILSHGFDEEHAVIYVDSELTYKTCCDPSYAAAWKRRGWKKANGETPLNMDLVVPLYSLYNSLTNVKLSWIPGHMKIKGNEEADRLAARGN